MAYSLIAHTKESGVNTFTTPAIDTTGANLLVVFVVRHYGFSPTFSDSKGNSWTKLSDNATTGGTGAFFYCFNPTVGSGHTFTLTGTSYGDIAVQAWSGAVSSPFDVEHVSNTTGTSLATGSVSPNVDGELIVAGLSINVTNTYNIDSSFTISDQIPFSSGSYYGIAAAYLVQTTKGAVNPTWSWTNSAAAAAAIACFKPSSGTSGGSPFIFQPFAI
jgi:hypothetical protein